MKTNSIKKAASCFMFAVIAVFGLQAQNDQIAWGGHNAISGDSDVSTEGTLVGTYSPYLILNPGISSVTVNGVTFQANSLNAIVSGMTNSTTMGITTNANGTLYLTDANYADLLTGASDTPFDTSGYIIFSNLIAGASYEIEIWAQDAYYNPPAYDQWENFQNLSGHGTSGDSANVNYDENHTAVSGECIGHYITGTFTASNTVQTIAISNAMEWSQQLPSGSIVNTYGQGQINLLQLREIGAPPPQNLITWGSVGTISGDSDVVTNRSTLVGTYSPYLILNPGISSLTVNGVAFQSNSLNVVTSGTTNSTTMGINANLSDPNYANLLSGASEGTYNSEGYIMFSNVLPGSEYEVQIWAENINEPTYDQWEDFWTITTMNDSGGVYDDANGSQTGSGIGQFITGTFTPTTSNSVVEISWLPYAEAWGSGSISSTFGQGQINLLQLRLLENPPSITTQPPNISYVAYGTNATVTAVAGGSPTLAYQWYETNLTSQTGAILTGQTNATLVVSNLTSSADYYLVVTNQYGSTNSAIASVVVYTSPLLVSQFPVTYTNPFTLYAGANPIFSVKALGLTTLGYQWFTNGVLDGTATTSALQLANVQIGTFSNYCIVTNSYGSVTSTVWSASIIADPVGAADVGLAPYPQAVLALSPIGYWRLNDTNLDGLDNNDGDSGYICHDYAGGNDGIYTNVYLGYPGYNPLTDPSDTSPLFGEDADGGSDFGDQDANSIAGINFGSPSGTSVAFTVEAWVNGYPQSSDAGIVTLGWGSGGEQFDLDCGSDTSPTSHGFRFLIRDASGNAHAVSSTIEPTYGNWYHLVGVVDEISSQKVAFYINGQSVGTASVASGSGILSSTNLMGIGSRIGSATTNFNYQFVGNLNDVAIFDYALSPAQVVNQYIAGGGTVSPFFSPQPVTNAAADANTTLTIPVTAIGTSPIGYEWTNLNTGVLIASGATNATSLNATLNYGNVPASWNGDQLELIVTNAYGSTNAFVTLSIANVNLNPTNIIFGATNNELYLSWPADHVGWQLQAQTNSLSVGISTNWVNVTGSTSTNQFVIPINLTNGSVFYRLIGP